MVAESDAEMKFRRGAAVRAGECVAAADRPAGSRRWRRVLVNAVNGWLPMGLVPGVTPPWRPADPGDGRERVCRCRDRTRLFVAKGTRFGVGRFATGPAHGDPAAPRCRASPRGNDVLCARHHHGPRGRHPEVADPAFHRPVPAVLPARRAGGRLRRARRRHGRAHRTVRRQREWRAPRSGRSRLARGADRDGARGRALQRPPTDHRHHPRSRAAAARRGNGAEVRPPRDVPRPRPSSPGGWSTTSAACPSPWP